MAVVGVFFLVFLGVFAFLLPIMAIISLLGKNVSSNDRLIWVLIILFMPLIGSVLYFFIGRPKFVARKIKDSKQNFIKQ